jgi:hypothetical protein
MKYAWEKANLLIVLVGKPEGSDCLSRPRLR